jgi:translation elongation factor EF-1alpha
MKEVKPMEEQEVGRVADYFAKIGVAGIEITGQLAVGDTIRIKGHTTDFQQTVDSMQMEHASVQEAKPGDSVGIKVKDRCRAHDRIFKVSE